MSRRVAVAWHASFSIIAGVLYALFVLPRWWELSGEVSHTLGTVLRIVTGAVIGLAALPVVFTLLRTRKPELGTPQLALSLRTSSIGLHVLAGVLIIGTAISELWLSLDSAGRWLFGIYGAAAAIALLGILAFYLAFVAELPPPPPKPVKPRAAKRRRGRRTAEEADSADDTEAAEEAAVEDTEAAEEAAVEESAVEESGVEDEPAEVTAVTDDADGGDTEDVTDASEKADGGLRNRRPSGKITLRKRKRQHGGVAVDD